MKKTQENIERFYEVPYKSLSKDPSAIWGKQNNFISLF